MADVIFIIYLIGLVAYCFMCGNRKIVERARVLWFYYFADLPQWSRLIS